DDAHFLGSQTSAEEGAHDRVERVDGRGEGIHERSVEVEEGRAYRLHRTRNRSVVEEMQQIDSAAPPPVRSRGPSGPQVRFRSGAAAWTESFKRVTVMHHYVPLSGKITLPGRFS